MRHLGKKGTPRILATAEKVSIMRFADSGTTSASQMYSGTILVKRRFKALPCKPSQNDFAKQLATVLNHV